MANKTVYPFGQNGQLPSGYPIVDDLVTGGADKALSAAQGVVLNQKVSEILHEETTDTEVDVSELTEYPYFMQTVSENSGGAATWRYQDGTSGKMAKVALVSVQGIDKVVFSMSTYSSRIAMLRSENMARNEPIDFATGWNDVLIPGVAETHTFDVPRDATAIAFSTMSMSGVSVKDDIEITLKTISRGGILYVEDVVDGLDSNDAQAPLSAKQGKELGNGLDEVQKVVLDTDVDLSSFDEYGAFASGAEVGATWSTDNKSIFIPVDGGAAYKITGNHTHTSYIMFVTAVYEQGDTIHWATGWNRRRPIMMDKTEIVTAPTMAGQQVYLCVLTSDAAGTTDYKPTIKLMGKLDKQGVNVHLFTFADSTERIPIVTTADADVSQYDNSIIGLHSTIRVGEYLYCFYIATNVAPANVDEYSYRVCAAYSRDGQTWTRGFHSPDIHPADGIEGTNVVIRSIADGKAYSLSDICIVKVPDNEYPYRMIGQKTTPPQSGTLTNKEMWMWKSADCFSWVEMNKIVNGRYDTSTSAIVCGQVIKLYIRNWDHSIPSGQNKDRRIGRAYVDIWGNLLTPPHYFFGNYLYNAGASKIDDRRELLLPTYFDWNVTNVQDIELRSYLVDGDDVKEITTNINDALTASEKWAWVMPGLVSVDCEQYVSLTTAERYHNDKTVAKSGIYLVKVQMDDGVSDQNDD